MRGQRVNESTGQQDGMWDGVEGEEPPAPEVIETMYRDVDAFNKKMMEAGRLLLERRRFRLTR